MGTKTYLLAKAILERKDILFGVGLNGSMKQQNSKEKEEAWEDIKIQMVKHGFLNFQQKNWRDVRNHDWQYLRRTAVAKLEHNQKSPTEQLKYTEVDELVFGIIGISPLNGVYNFYGEEEICHTGFSQLSEENESLLLHIDSEPILVNTEIARTNKKMKMKKVSSVTSSPSKLSPKEEMERNQLHENICRKLSDTNSSYESNVDPHSRFTKDETCPQTSNNFSQHSAKGTKAIRSNNDVLNYVKCLKPEEKITSKQRKRAHSSISAEEHEFDPQSYQFEATTSTMSIELKLIEIRREELILQQEWLKLEQEKSKLEQEKAKFEQEKAKFEWHKVNCKSSASGLD